ncbi:MAG: 6-phosphogluconolactonase, partial [Leucobacter sp.]
MSGQRAALRVERVADLPSLGEAAAAAIIGICAARQTEGAVPCILLTGGRAGAAVLAAIAGHARRGEVDWRRVRLLWGDERWLPAGDSERNDRLADELLLGAVDADPALVHRIAASDAGRSLDEAAAEYAAIVAGVDRVDLALNGVGEDGHIASLFPGREDLLRDGSDGEAVPDAFAVRESPKPPPERVTLSLPALRRAERVWLFATGAGKADAERGIRVDR